MSLASIGLLGSRTVFDERGHPYTLYDLRLTTAEGSTWSTEKRFSEFRQLSQQLTERHKSGGDAAAFAPPALPKEILTAGWFSGQSLSPDFVKRREKGLRVWLRDLLAALPANDELLVGALAPTGARRRMMQPAASPTSPSSSVSSPRAAKATTLPSPSPPPSKSSGVAWARPRATLTWELVWEAPEEQEQELDLSAPLDVESGPSSPS